MVLGKVKTFLGFLAVGIGGSFMTSLYRHKKIKRSFFKIIKPWLLLKSIISIALF